jgi:RNA polymerase sigma factor (sigma-70 family)
MRALFYFMVTMIQFEELVKKLSPTLKRIAYRLKNSFAFFNDEDLYQEALLRLWQDYNNGKLSDKTDSYILQGCYYHMKNYIRLQKIRKNTVSLNVLVNTDSDLIMEELLGLGEDISAEYLRQLDNRLVAETIQNNGLTSKEKRILCFYAQGLTTRQVGERLGVSHVRIVKITALIRGKCKKYLDPVEK